MSRFVAKDIGIIAQNKTTNLKKFKIVRKFGLIPPIKVIIRDIIAAIVMIRIRITIVIILSIIISTIHVYVKIIVMISRTLIYGHSWQIVSCV